MLQFLCRMSDGRSFTVYAPVDWRLEESAAVSQSQEAAIALILRDYPQLVAERIELGDY